MSFFNEVELNRENFPKLCDLLIISEQDNVYYVPLSLNIYPTKCLYINRMISIRDDYFCDKRVKKLKDLTIHKHKLQFIEKTTQFKNLEIEQTRTFFERIKG